MSMFLSLFRIIHANLVILMFILPWFMAKSYVFLMSMVLNFMVVKINLFATGKSQILPIAIRLSQSW